MTVDQAYPRQMRLNEQLTRLARQFHHLQNHYKRRAPAGSVAHLRQEAQRAEERFEALLGRIQDDGIRHKWREHLHYRGPAPTAPELPLRPHLLFRGRSDSGAMLEVYETQDGSRRFYIDGSIARRPSGGPQLVREGRTTCAEIDGRYFREEWSADDRVMGLLADWARGRRQEPPWEVVGPLLEEGLADLNFALTDRGRRVLTAWRG